MLVGPSCVSLLASPSAPLRGEFILSFVEGLRIGFVRLIPSVAERTELWCTL